MTASQMTRRGPYSRIGDEARSRRSAPRHARGHQNVSPARFSRFARALFEPRPAAGDGESGAALPVADEASRFQGSAPFGGHECGQQTAGATRAQPRRPRKKSPPDRVVIFFAVSSAVPSLRQPSAGHIRARQTGRCLESGLLHLPQAALRRFPRRPLRAEARTGHERSEKNVPVTRFGARVRVAALSAVSEPRRRFGCTALVVSSDWPSHLFLPVRTLP